MPGRRGVRLAAAVVTLAAGLGALPGAASAAHADDDTSTSKTPLSLTITSLTPGSLPAHGPIVVKGTVTNDDHETWTGVRIYPFRSQAPMTTSAQLSAAAATPADADVGSRITNWSDTDLVGDIAPGKTVHYTLRISRSDLGLTEPGVYWFGVHALGASNSSPGDIYADGRARTFLPVVRGHHAPTPLSLLLPVRARVLRTASGRVADEAGWTEDLTRGHLASILDFGATQPVTWLVDPAVLDAVRQLAAGNPTRDLDPVAFPSPSPSASASVSASASASPSASTSPPVPTASPSTTSDPDLAPAMKAAQSWLRRFVAAVAGHEVLTLPYGDPDLSAVAAHDPTLAEDARAEASSVMSSLGIDAQPAAAPPDGYVDAHGLALVSGGTTILSSAAVRGHTGTVVSLGGTSVDLTSAGADAGGPRPGHPYSGVALRQRILAQAAVERSEPMLVSLPWKWQAPTPSRAFFDGLDVPWLSIEPVTGSTAEPPVSIPLSRLVYPRSEARAQVAAGVFPLVNEMIRLGDALSDILVAHTDVADQVLRDALTSTSYAARSGHGDAALASTRALTATLAGVRLDPPPAVTLSGASGRFSVSVSNDLPERVKVEIKPAGDAGISLRTPGPVEIGPNGSTSVLMTADTATNGVHHVLLHLTSSNGVPLGSTVELQIRSAQVSKVIWGFIGVGLGILAIAIGIRLTRRVRRSGA